MNLFRSLAQWFRKCCDRFGPARRLVIVEGDSLPTKMPFCDLVLARDGGEDWSVGMKCPCGCGQEAKLRWDVEVDADGFPNLTPCVWADKRL